MKIHEICISGKLIQITHHRSANPNLIYRALELIEELHANKTTIYPFALKTAKTLWSFGRFECNGVNPWQYIL